MGIALPPAAEIRNNGEPGTGRNRMVPSGAPADASGAELSANACTFPPFSSTVFNFPPAKNPSKRPSGDQKGDAAPSVPGMAVASLALSERVHTLIAPSRSMAVNASLGSSGQTTAGAEAKTESTE